MTSRNKKLERAQCSIRLLELKQKESDALEAINRMCGVISVRLDNANRMILVDYDPAAVTFQEIQQKVKRKSSSA
jgi:hypothetical protein